MSLMSRPPILLTTISRMKIGYSHHQSGSSRTGHRDTNLQTLEVSYYSKYKLSKIYISINLFREFLISNPVTILIAPVPENTHQSNNPTSYPNFESSNNNTATTTTKSPLDVTTRSLSGLESLVDQIPSIAEAEAVGSNGIPGGNPSLCQDSVAHTPSVSLPSVTSAVTHAGHYTDGPSGFLPYGHGAAAAAAYGATHPYVSSPYYASELSSNFHVNSLSSPYCTPTPSSSLMFGYPGYHSQYTSASGPAGYGSAGGASSFHLPSTPYGNHSGFTSPYSGPNPYAHGAHSMSGAANQAAAAAASQRLRDQQRFHLRQEGMDLGHLGFGGF